MIVSMHVLGPHWITDNNVNKVLIIVINAFCNTGVSMFILISGYYGIKFKDNRLFYLINLSFFFSVLIDCVISWNVADGKSLVSHIFPVLTGKHWFLTSYVILYCLSGFINSFAARLEKREYKVLLLILLLFFYVAPTFLDKEILNDDGKGIVNMVTLYLIGRYIATYGFPDFIKRHTVAIILLSFCLIVILNTAITFLTGPICGLFSRDNNILILAESVSIFYLFIRMKTRSNIRINHIAQYVFPIYMIHYGGMQWIHFAFDDNSLTLIPLLLCEVIAILAACIIVENIRRIILGKIFEKVENLEVSLLHKIKKNFSSIFEGV